MHSFDLPQPLSGKSTSVLLDFAVLHLCLVNHPGPNHELVIRSCHLPTFHFFLRTFLHSSISSAFIVFCRFTAPVTCPSLSGPVAPLSSERTSCPRRRTSTHSPRCLPRSSAENFAVLLLPRLRAPAGSTCAFKLFGGRLPPMVRFRLAGTTGPSKSVGPSASSAAYFVFSSGSDGASSISSSGSDGASSISSSGYDGVPHASSSRTDGASRVSSAGSDDGPYVSSSGSNGTSRVSSSGFGGSSRVSSLRWQR